VTTNGNLISIQAKHENRNEEKRDNKIVKQEHFVGMMSRTLTLPNDADPEKYTTDYKDGILTVTIEKRK
jgi:HSP20 family protein